MAEQASHPVVRRRRAPVIFLIALALISLLLHATRYFRGREIARQHRQYAELLRTKPIAATKARRTRFYETRYFLGYATSVSFAVADLTRRIADLVPPLRLRSLQIDPGLQDLGFELTVEIAGVGPRKARLRLADFLERLRLTPGVTSADLPGPGPIARGGGVRVFTVNGRAELQP